MAPLHFTRGYRRRPSATPAACAGLLEPLEPRALLSGITSSTFVFNTTASTAPIFVPESDPGPQSAGASDLIHLTDFRADPRFSWVDGSGFSSVILDTGIDLNHPFFGPDTNGDGVADRIVYQHDFGNNDNNASDVNGHGSNVSSIVASSDSTYRGMAPAAGIIHLKVFTDAGGGNFAMIEQALQWVVAHAVAYNIASVNMSLGDTANYNSPQQLYGIADELSALAGLNVLVVSAAGNSFSTFGSAQGVSYPAADPNSLAVGAVYALNAGGFGYASGATAYTSGPDVITPFSQRSATMVDIFAPGAPITGAGPTGGLLTEHGTSQAAPHIAGIGVLAQQLAMQVLGRRLTLGEFASLLASSGDAIVDGDDENDNVTNTGLTFKRVNVEALGQAILDMAPSGPRARITQGSAPVNDGSALITFGATFIGAPRTQTFTITNIGTDDLVLTEPINVPAGFAVASSFGATTLAPGQATTFTISLAAEVAGSYSGDISFMSNDASDDTYSFSVNGTVAAAGLVDDGNAGFGLTGTWTVGSSTSAYLSDFRYHAAGTGANAATWTFTGLIPGQYRFSAHWVADAARASNAPFSVLDNLTQVGAAAVNQRLAPNDRTVSGVTWEDFATVNIASGTARVRLSDHGNGVVVADGVRMEYVGPQVFAPRTVVALATTALADGVTAIGYGSVMYGTTSTRTFTISNTGNADLTLSDLVVPSGFGVVSPFGASTLAPNASTNFTVGLNTSVLGAVSGTVSFATNDTPRNPFNFTVSATVIQYATNLDDGAAGFSTTGTWTLVSGAGLASDYRTKAAGGGSAAATWTFGNVPAGEYRVSATWVEATNRATNAPYVVLDGVTQAASVTRNQRVAPNDRTVNGVAWEDLATLNVASGTVVVRLADNANGFVVADGVRLERLGPRVLGPRVAVLNGTSAVADGTGSVSFGAPFIGTPISKTLTVRNTGYADLTLTEPINVPAGFTLVSSFTATTLTPGQSATFVVRMDSNALGARGGTLSFDTDDPLVPTVDFTLSGTVVAARILDDGMVGHTTAGAWTVGASTAGYAGDYRYHAAGTGSGTSSWTFASLLAGNYRVSANWIADPNRASNAPYVLLDGATTLLSRTMNQRLASHTRVDSGFWFADLGTVTVSGGTLVVRLNDHANGYVFADAVRLEYLGPVG